MSDYQEYNEAKLEVAIPAEEQVELTLEYGGFPRESMPTMQGSKGAQRRIPLSGERGPLSPPDERDARRRRLSRHN